MVEDRINLIFLRLINCLFLSFLLLSWIISFYFENIKIIVYFVWNSFLICIVPCKKSLLTESFIHFQIHKVLYQSSIYLVFNYIHISFYPFYWFHFLKSYICPLVISFTSLVLTIHCGFSVLSSLIVLRREYLTSYV